MERALVKESTREGKSESGYIRVVRQAREVKATEEEEEEEEEGGEVGVSAYGFCNGTHPVGETRSRPG